MDPRSFNIRHKRGAGTGAAALIAISRPTRRRSWPLQYNCWSGYTSVLREDRFE